MIDSLIKQIDDLEVDRSARVLASGNPVPEDNSHTQIGLNGQQKEYVVVVDHLSMIYY